MLFAALVLFVALLSVLPMGRLLPREIVEAARASGAGIARVLRDVVIPVMTPALVAGGLSRRWATSAFPLCSAFRPATPCSPHSYVEVLARQDATIRAFRNSFFLAGGAAVTLVGVSLVLAYFVTRRRSRILGALNLAAELPYALPGVVLAIAAILIFLKPLPLLGFSIYNTVWIIFAAYLARFLTLSLRPVISGVGGQLVSCPASI